MEQICKGKRREQIIRVEKSLSSLNRIWICTIPKHFFYVNNTKKWSNKQCCSLFFLSWNIRRVQILLSQLWLLYLPVNVENLPLIFERSPRVDAILQLENHVTVEKKLIKCFPIWGENANVLFNPTKYVLKGQNEQKKSHKGQGGNLIWKRWGLKKEKIAKCIIKLWRMTFIF